MTIERLKYQNNPEEETLCDKWLCRLFKLPDSKIPNPKSEGSCKIGTVLARVQLNKSDNLGKQSHVL